jgi:ribosomal protein L20
LLKLVLGTSVVRLSQKYEDCKQREFLSSFFDGIIEYQGKSIDFGVTDLAIIEMCIDSLEKEEHLTVINPFSYPILPVLISYAYMFSSHPNLNSKLNNGLPMLLLPKNGYIGQFDNFEYESGENLNKVMKKENIDSKEGLKDKHNIYRATSPKVLEAEGRNIGLLFVDLRKESWKEHLAAIETFMEKNDVNSAVFYADEEDYSSEISKRISTDKFRMTGELMSKSNLEEPGKNPTRGRKQEAIFSNTLEINFISINDSDVVDKFRELYQLLCKIRDNNLQSYSPTKVFNLLANLVVSPKRFDRQSSENYYFTSIDSLMNSLEGYASDLESPESDLINNFRYTSQDIIENLNNSNPKANVALDIIEKAKESEKEHKLVVKNMVHKKTLEKFFAERDINLCNTIQVRSEVEPSNHCTYIYLMPPWAQSSIYEFPPSARLIFMIYPFQQGYIESSFSDNCPVQYESKRLDIDGTSEQYEFNMDQVRHETAKNILSEDKSTNTSYRSEGGENVAIDLEEGKNAEFQEESIVSVFDSEKNTVVRKKAKNLRVGDRLVLLSDARDDIYSVLIEEEHTRDRMKKKENLIQKWRTVIQEALESDEWSYEEILKELRDKGSSISGTLTLRNWAKGDVIGPQDREDVRRILAVLSPEYEAISDEIYDAMQYIRIEHRKMARKVRSLIEAKMDPMASVNTQEISEGKLKNIQDEVEVKRVVSEPKSPEA